MVCTQECFPRPLLFQGVATTSPSVLPTSARAKHPQSVLRKQEKLNQTSKWVQKPLREKASSAQKNQTSLGTWTQLPPTCCSHPKKGNTKYSIIWTLPVCPDGKVRSLLSPQFVTCKEMDSNELLHLPLPICSRRTETHGVSQSFHRWQVRTASRPLM